MPQSSLFKYWLTSFSARLNHLKVKLQIEEEESIKHLASAWERADTSFFAGTRPRLRRWTCSNMVLGKEMQLDRDLLIFQRALNNKVPDWPEVEDWKLQLIIDQFQNSQLKAMMPKFLRFVLTRSLPRNNTLYVVLQQKCWFWHFCFHKNIIRLTLRVKITRQ